MISKTGIYIVVQRQLVEKDALQQAVLRFHTFAFFGS
jgi:hypothetical protein